jgi:hypothetical protein
MFENVHGLANICAAAKFNPQRDGVSLLLCG